MRDLLICKSCAANRCSGPQRCAWGAGYHQCPSFAEPRGSYCMAHQLLERGEATGGALLGRRDAAAFERNRELEQIAEALEPLLQRTMAAGVRWRDASDDEPARTALRELRKAGEAWCERQLEHRELGCREALYATLLTLREAGASELPPRLRVRVDVLRNADLSKPVLRRQAAPVGLVDDVPLMLRFGP